MAEPQTEFSPARGVGAPTSTYRLQLHADFGFADTLRRLDYLRRLGVSHLYLSPILQAAPGSMHGYDVIDHTRVSDDLGGVDEFVALSRAARARGLGIVVDVVPNHMAIPTPASLNARWWDVLRSGRESESAEWFDIDWDLWSGRIGLPVLDRPVAELIAAGTLRRDEADGQPVLRYGDQLLPVANGTEHLSLPELLEHQHYRLGHWQDPTSLGYRRFFDVDTLVAIRVERDDVFDDSHRLLLELYRDGLIDGFRIDHPDGLADPEGYLERLHDRTDGAWVVVEKVLTPGERLPTSWPCAGTTGYDSLQAVSAALAPPTSPALSELWTALGGEPSLHRAEEQAKRQVLTEILEPELLRLTRCAESIPDVGIPAEPLREALAELLAYVDVYRAYLRLGRPPIEESEQQLDRLVELARASRPDLDEVLTLLRRLLAASTATDAATRELVVRFQQVCGPVMAKGVEDTTFYRWHRLIALEEVGGDPLALDAADPRVLHDWAELQSSTYPTGMTTTSTHDTKRSEDVRARLLALAEDADGWATAWAAVRDVAESTGLDLPTAYLLFQTVLGAWPIDLARLQEYMQKAVREAKQHTSWRAPDEDYERVVAACCDRCLAGPVAGAVNRLLGDNAEPIRATTLAGKLLALTLPGVPDCYQGSESVRRDLVDPDNRRPVDYDLLESALSRLDAGAAPQGLEEEKMALTAAVLRLRRAQPGLFDAGEGYRPLDAGTPHLLGFVRGDRLATLVTRWPRRVAADGWGDAPVQLLGGTWTDVLGGSSYDTSAPISCRELFAARPVALLLRAD